MTELQLYKFVTQNLEEPIWSNGELWVAISYWEFEDFMKLAEIDDEFIRCMETYLHTRGIQVNLVEICDYHDIDASVVFPEY